MTLRKKFTDLTMNDTGTEPYRRAIRFVDVVARLVEEFIPRHRDVRRAFRDSLFTVAWENALDIIEVPPEWDALDEAALKAAMLEAKIAKFPPVFPAKTPEILPEVAARNASLEEVAVRGLCKALGVDRVFEIVEAIRNDPPTSAPAREVDGVLRNYDEHTFVGGERRYSGALFFSKNRGLIDGALVTTEPVLSGPDADGVIVTKNSTYRLEPKP